MRKVRFVSEFPIPRDGETTTVFPAGWKGEISEEDYAAARKANAVELVDGEKASKAARPARPADPSELLAAIVAVLDPNDKSLFNKDGRPSVKALEGKLGYQISEAERDTAWAQVQQKLNV